MTPRSSGRGVRLGRALARAWVGYQTRLDAELTAAGFTRALPNGRVLRICARFTEPTISQIGRELGITRQGASKLIAGLRDRGYVMLRPSPEDGREKLVELTPRAIDYLAAQRNSARNVERRLRAELGADGFETLFQLLEAIGGDEQPRMSDYLRKAVDQGLLATVEGHKTGERHGRADPRVSGPAAVRDKQRAAASRPAT
jgi:DNA-binding MarR family transcriptional regulator